MIFQFSTILTLLSACLLVLVGASPALRSFDDQHLPIQRRTQAFFPETPASCPICAKVSWNAIAQRLFFDQ